VPRLHPEKSTGDPVSRIGAAWRPPPGVFTRTRAGASNGTPPTTSMRVDSRP
jgi:hypothetical protein